MGTMTTWIILLTIVAAALTVMRDKMAWRFWSVVGIVVLVDLLFIVSAMILSFAGIDKGNFWDMFDTMRWYGAYGALGQTVWMIVAFWMASYTRKMGGKASS